jgi:hypothetical protein
MIRLPVGPFSDDAYRYVGEIEKEFAGHAATNVLLDAGSWIYLRNRVVMKDRAPSIGDRGYAEVGNFGPMIERLEQKRYAKILVRNFHSADLWYDHWLWRRSSQIRQALTRSYSEVRTIRRVAGSERIEELDYLFSDISVLVPKPD